MSMGNKDKSFAAGLVVLGVAVVLAGLGFAALIRSGVGLSSQDVAVGLLVAAAVAFLIGLVLVGSGHTDAPPTFCNRCGAIVPDDATACPECGRELHATSR